MLGTVTPTTDRGLIAYWLSANCDGCRHLVRTAIFPPIACDDAWHSLEHSDGSGQTEGDETMITVIRGLAVGAVLACAAVGLAGPASAEPLSGDYTSSLIDAGPVVVRPGNATPVTFTPCGPDCTHYATQNIGYDLHLQGTTWTGTFPGKTGSMCTATLDNNSLEETSTCEGGTPLVFQLTKNG
jgi:hypothetical protein